MSSRTVKKRPSSPSSQRTTRVKKGKRQSRDRGVWVDDSSDEDRETLDSVLSSLMRSHTSTLLGNSTEDSTQSTISNMKENRDKYVKYFDEAEKILEKEHRDYLHEKSGNLMNKSSAVADMILKDIDKAMREREISLNSFNSTTILKRKVISLKEYGVDGELLSDLLKRLKFYRHIDELHELHLGNYIRWCNISSLERWRDVDHEYPPKLTNGGILVDIYINENGICLTCRNYAGRFFSLSMHKNVIYQKLNSQEELLIALCDFVED
jgi:hypothetical protein